MVMARNVAEVRRQRDLSVRELSVALAAIGVNLIASAISKVENGQRRLTAEELAAFAVVLQVAPARLMLPAADDGDLVQLAPEVAVPWQDAWRWATGDAPLGEYTDEQFTRWLRQNRPHDDQAIFAAWVAVVEQTPGHTVERDECGRVVAITSPVKSVRRTADGGVEKYEEMRRTVYDCGPGMKMPPLPPERHWRGADDAGR